MLPAILLLIGGTFAATVWRNKDQAKTLADTAIRSAFQGKRELQAMVGQLLDGTGEPEPAVWVNVDKPASKATMHAESCRYVQSKHETALKGVGELKREGGWLCFQSLDEAQEAYPTAQPAKDGCWGSASAS